MSIVDCKRIDDEVEIEACSVQVTSMTAREVGWKVQPSTVAAKLERKLLLALLVDAPAVAEATSTGEAASAEPSLLGWLVAAVVTMIFVTKLLMERFEVRPKRSKRDVLVQGPTTYKTRSKLDGELPGWLSGRFTPLAERDFDAWPTD